MLNPFVDEEGSNLVCDNLNLNIEISLNQIKIIFSILY